MIKTIYFRKYGEPKIRKPKELKGVKKCKSAKLRGRNTDLYIKDNEIWIYFGDFLSEETTFPEQEDASMPANALIRKYGLSTGKKKGFVYNDAWCTFLNRNEAWLSINKTAKGIKSMKVSEINLYVYYLIDYIQKSPINKAMGECCTLNTEMNRVISELLLFIKTSHCIGQVL